MDLTDAEWNVLAPFFPERERKGSSGPKGGRPYRGAREVLDGIRWVLRTGAPWSEMPKRYPPPSTCHRRFQRWAQDRTLKRALHALAEHCESTASWTSTKRSSTAPTRGPKGGAFVGRNRRGTATKIMAIADANGLPLAVGIACGQRHELLRRI